MRIIYEADDGSTFEELEECEQYELEELKPLNDILGITSEGDRITYYTSEWNDSKSFIEVANAIYFKTDKAIDAFKEREGFYQSYGTEGYKNFETGVIYHYDRDYDDFVPLDDTIYRCQEKLKRLNKYADEMSKFVNASTN